MDGLFEYLRNPLCHKEFEDSVCKFLKGERSWFKHMFMRKGQWTRLMGIEPSQWERLMKY
jgi:hypothetical protein